MPLADKIRNEAHIAHGATQGAFHRVDHDVKHSSGGAPSPAIGRDDIPFDVVGPFLRFSGVDLDTSTWNGSCLLLVRLPGEGNDGVTRRHNGKASSPREVEPLETSSTRNHFREHRMVDGMILPIIGSGVSSETTGMLQRDEFGVPLPPRERLSLQGTSTGFGWKETTPVSSQQPRLILRERGLDQWNQTTTPSGSSAAGDTFKIDPTILMEDIFGFRVWRFDIAIRQNQEYSKIIDYCIDIPSLGATESSPEIAIDDLPQGPNQGSTGSRHSPSLATKEWNAWHSFVVPGLETKMRAAFFSCNGFETTTRDAPEGAGLPTLWTDVLRSHMKSPFHVLIGGGDQIYNDDVFNSPNQPINEWMNIESRSERESYPWTKEMDAFAKSFYFKNYCLHFMTKPYADVIRTIPHVFTCDDHDIFDGFGSYPSALQNSPVFQGIGAVAIQAYLLFQHHTTSDLARDHGLFPARPGSNGSQRRGFNFVVRVNRSVAIVGLDNRTERSKDRVFSDESREALKEAMRMEAFKGGLEHTLILNEQSKGSGRIVSSAAEEKRVDMIGLRSLAPQYIGQLEE
ncbi:hypothetical protein M427DRAFT_34849 [Gonapodya prolifera JEL478]|uniref:PhoD-like phosphatase domain-containing protein n=1 Tax=Gonapodya prolifera (strain JEL478) TaxID=1344416 RepID=A0A139A641_GONPJ|nr:hypothetical protein M427DRAFT_34849 [Gonapodya prolifera JEL478]|eukprot:KXS12290.1 hypothetical protein M427DRAFT_34849 [Gonapodya prolifera JEL478]